MTNQRFFFFLLLYSFLNSSTTKAYVAGTASLPEGGVEVTAKSEFMRGKAGPENLPESQQTQKPEVNIFEMSAGYSFGTMGVLQDLKVRLSGTYFTSASESLGGTLKYARDEGGIAGVELSSNLLHDVDKVFGVFLRSQIPIDMDIAKFVNPKIDRVGVGLQTGFKFNDYFGQETIVFFGSGISDNGYKQNGSLSASLVGVWILKGGIFEHGASVRMGPFYDGDLGERNDSAYGTLGVRAFRLGLTTSASYSFTKNFSMDLNYIQKFTGNYFRATTDFIASVRAVF